MSSHSVTKNGVKVTQTWNLSNDNINGGTNGYGYKTYTYTVTVENTATATRYYSVSPTVTQNVSGNENLIASAWYPSVSSYSSIAAGATRTLVNTTIDIPAVNVTGNMGGGCSAGIFLQSKTSSTGTVSYGEKTTAFTPAQIDRSSTVSVSGATLYAGNVQDITVTKRASQNLTHQLYYVNSSGTGTLIGSIANSGTYNWTIPRTVCEAVDITLTITCKSYSDTTLVGTKTATFTLKAYSPPTAADSQVYRSNAAGEADNTNGNYLGFAPVFTKTQTGNNNVTLEVFVNKETTATPDYIGTEGTGGALTFNPAISNNLIYPGNATTWRLTLTMSAVVRVKITDTLGGTTTSVFTVSTASRVLSYKEDGKGAAIGGLAVEDDLHIRNWDMYVEERLLLALDSTADADLIQAISDLGWTSDVIE